MTACSAAVRGPGSGPALGRLQSGGALAISSRSRRRSTRGEAGSGLPSSSVVCQERVTAGAAERSWAKR